MTDLDLAQLEDRLRAYGQVPVRRVDAAAMARWAVASSRPGPDRRPVMGLLAAALLVAALAASMIALGAGAWLERRLADGPPPPAEDEEMFGLPPALQYRWIGQPRDIPGHGSSPVTMLEFVHGRLAVVGSAYPDEVALSDARLDARGALRLLHRYDARDCDQGADGAYDWSLSQGGTVLTIKVLSDPCQTRIAAVSGTWHRVGQETGSGARLGALEAGSCCAVETDTLQDFSAPLPRRAGTVAYTVPERWSSMLDPSEGQRGCRAMPPHPARPPVRPA